MSNDLPRALSTFVDQCPDATVRVSIHDACGTNYLDEWCLFLGVESPEIGCENHLQRLVQEGVYWQSRHWEVVVFEGIDGQTDTVSIVEDGRVYLSRLLKTLSRLEYAAECGHSNSANSLV